MDRRRFMLASLAGAITSPLTAEAQQAQPKRQIGVLVHSIAPVGQEIGRAHV